MMAAVLQQQLREVGIALDIRTYEFATFFADIQKRNFEAYCLKWTSVSDPELINKVFHSKEIPPGKNRIYYNNHAVDELLEKAQTEVNLSKRRALYFKVEHKIEEDMPYISLWYLDNTAVAAKSLKDISLHTTGSWEPFLDAKKESK